MEPGHTKLVTWRNVSSISTFPPYHGGTMESRSLMLLVTKAQRGFVHVQHSNSF